MKILFEDGEVDRLVEKIKTAGRINLLTIYGLTPLGARWVLTPLGADPVGWGTPLGGAEGREGETTDDIKRQGTHNLHARQPLKGERGGISHYLRGSRCVYGAGLVAPSVRGWR
jgi:hypothetical protein